MNDFESKIKRKISEFEGEEELLNEVEEQDALVVARYLTEFLNSSSHKYSAERSIRGGQPSEYALIYIKIDRFKAYSLGCLIKNREIDKRDILIRSDNIRYYIENYEKEIVEYLNKECVDSKEGIKVVNVYIPKSDQKRIVITVSGLKGTSGF